MTFTIALSVNLCRSKKICSTDIREENANLSKERAALQSEVERQRILMKELSEQMDGLRSSTAAERKERAKAALRVSEGIAAEREAIVSELNLMRVINTKMVDERDLVAEGTVTHQGGSSVAQNGFMTYRASRL